MPIRYVSSLDLPSLAKELQGNIEKNQSEFPLREELILLPNQNLKKWIQIHLTDESKEKISVNLRYSFLDAFLKELSYLSKGYVKIGNNEFFIPPNSKKPLSTEEFLPLIFNKLFELPKENPKHWLSTYLSQIPKTYSLSKTLAGLFRDYELNRMGWIQSWAKEKKKSFLNEEIGFGFSSFKDQQTDDYFQFEKELYQSLFFSDKEPSLSLYSFYSQTLLQKEWKAPKSLGGIHLFCLANLSQTHLKILSSLSKAGLNLSIYHFFHGNMDSIHESGVQRWARPHINYAKEILSISSEKPKVLNPINEAPMPTGIKRLRELLNGVTNDTEVAKGDHSVRFWNAPSNYREMEAVANDILYKIQKDGCRYSDFVILLPNPEEYLSPIQWVFDGGILTALREDNSLYRQKIPYSLTDLGFKDSSVVFQLVSSLLDSLDSNGFSLKTFISLLRNPLLTGKELDFEKLQSLESLLNTLGVLSESGLEINTNANKAELDRFQISYGIRRLVLSLVLEESSGAKWDTQTIPNIAEEDAKTLIFAWENLTQLRIRLNSLLELKVFNATFNDNFSMYIREFFSMSTLGMMEKMALNIFLKKVANFQDLKLTNSEEVLALLREILADCFEDFSPAKGYYLTEGVTISMLQPFRPLPFKHLYILGLGEGKFPGRSNKSSFNLRSMYPESWDLDSRIVKESILWENLHSTGESVTLSYVGKNTKEDKTLEPSSSYLLLLRGYYNDISDSESYRKKIIEIPLVSYSSKYNLDDESKSVGLVSFDTAVSHVNGNAKKGKSRLKAEFVPPLPANTAKELAKNMQRTYREYELISFWKDPFETFLKKGIGLSLLEEEEETEDSIRFSLNALLNSAIEKQVLERIYPLLVDDKVHSIEDQKIKDFVEEASLVEKQKSLFPQNIFAELQNQILLDKIISYKDSLLLWKADFGWNSSSVYHPLVQFGQTGIRPELCALDLGSLHIEKEIEVLGEFPYIIEQNDRFFMLFPNSADLNVGNGLDEHQGYSDFFGKMARPFFASLYFKSQGKDLTVLFLKKKAESLSKDKGAPLFTHLNFGFSQSQAKTFLSELLNCLRSPDQTFVSRKGFESFLNSKEFESANENWQNNWIEFRDKNLTAIFNKAGELTQLNSYNLEESLEESSIQNEIIFLEKFYLPLYELLPKPKKGSTKKK